MAKKDIILKTLLLKATVENELKEPLRTEALENIDNILRLLGETK